jgi:hypothetical protein
LPNQGSGDQAPAPYRALTSALQADPDLARVVDAWPHLPPHLKAAVLALIATAPGPAGQE